MTTMLTCAWIPFQHTAARRRLGAKTRCCPAPNSFQHTAARRRLVERAHGGHRRDIGFNTQPPEGGWQPHRAPQGAQKVSTHSRPKAAGSKPSNPASWCWFQHTAARRRLAPNPCHTNDPTWVSTHSRPKAAGHARESFTAAVVVSTHSRPKAAGFNLLHDYQEQQCFNTQPPEGGWFWTKTASRRAFWFQHTAARRRLDRAAQKSSIRAGVSTHSRPKAAGNARTARDTKP